MYQLSRFLSLFLMAIAIAASQIVDCLDAGQQISLNFKNGMNEAKDHCLQLGYEIYREWAVPGVEKSPNSIDIIGLLFSSYETNRSNFKSLNDDSLIEILDQYGSICSDLIHSVERKNSLIRRDSLNSALEQHVNKQSGQIDEDRVDELIGSPGISDNLDNIEPINKIDEQSINASELIHEEPEIINGDQPVETEEPAESLPIETPQTEKQSDFHEQVIDEDSNKATELSPDITKEKVVEKPKESLMQNLMHIATSKKSAESKPSDEPSPVIDENKTAVSIIIHN